MKLRNIVAVMLSALCLAPCGAKKPERGALGHIQAASPAPEWLNSAVIYEANLRQGTPTRDLKGLQRELPRLKDLGADIIWLMPIHPISVKERKGTLGSYYAVQNYKEVNPEFGTMEDLKEFVRTAHSLGMKVILDEVCNHTGADNIWVEQHPEYYARNDKGEMFGPYDWTDTYKLDYSNPGTRAAMIDALKFWVSEADIDGYRCDVAGEVPTDFWEQARTELQAIKPVMMLAESDKPELLLKAFDIDYAWPMKDVFNSITLTKGVNKWGEEHKENRPKMNAQDIPALLEKQKSQYPAGAMHMNMITNHDLNSWEGTEQERLGNLTDAFAVLSYTLPGMPLIYTGQETGLNRALEFFKKDTPPEWEPRNRYFEFYKKLNHLKHTQPSLQAGAAGGEIVRYPTENDNLYIFSRAVDNKCVYVFVNLGNESADVKYTGTAPEGDATTVNFFTGATEEFPVVLNPGEYKVYVNR